MAPVLLSPGVANLVAGNASEINWYYLLLLM
jgi:hypothetical protein